MSKEIWHSGTVAALRPGVVVVKITSRSACGSCAAREACGLAEATEKIVEVRVADEQAFEVGRSVQVGVKKHIGGKAVVVAYVGALVAMLVALVVAVEVCGLADGWAVAVGLGAVAIYYGVLWLFRKKIDNSIQFSITQN